MMKLWRNRNWFIQQSYIKCSFIIQTKKKGYRHTVYVLFQSHRQSVVGDSCRPMVHKHVPERAAQAHRRRNRKCDSPGHAGAPGPGPTDLGVPVLGLVPGGEGKPSVQRQPARLPVHEATGEVRQPLRERPDLLQRRRQLQSPAPRRPSLRAHSPGQVGIASGSASYV